MEPGAETERKESDTSGPGNIGKEALKRPLDQSPYL